MATGQITITANTRQAELALGRVDRALGGIQRSAGVVSGAIRTATVALAGFATGAVIRNIVQTTARFQDLRTTLNTVTGSAQEGAAAFEFIQQFATQTQFGVEELTQTFIKLQGAGITPTTELLTTFTDAAAVTTDQLGSLQAITDLFSRTTAGGLGLEDLNRLVDRGLPVFDILEEKLGRNRLQLTELGRTAEGAQIILNALTEGINERFGGATQARINNISTQFSNLQIAITNAADAIGSQGFAMALGQTAVKITDLINNNQELVREIGVRLTQAFLVVIEVGKFLIANFGLIIKIMLVILSIKLAMFFIGIASSIIGLVRTIGAVFLPALAVMGRSILNVGKTLTMLIPGGWLVRGLILGIGAVATAFGLMGDEAEEETDRVSESFLDLDRIINSLGIEGFDEMVANIGNSREEAERLAAEANAVAEQAAAANAAYAAGTGNLQDQADALANIRKTFDEIVQEAERNAALAQINQETNAVTRGILTAQLDIGRELTDEERTRLTTLLQQVETANLQVELAKQMESAMAESTRLNITNLNLREEQAAVDERRLQLGRELTSEEEAQVRAIVRRNQANRETLAIEQARLQLAGEMNRVEAIQRGVDVQRRVDPERDLARERQADLDSQRALLDAGLINEQQYQQAVYQIRQEYANKANQLYIDQIEAEQRARQTAIQAEQMRLGKTAEQAATYAEFMMKTDAERAQFAIEQGATIFNELGRYNKEAFEAAKAFNIAQAIMNTYMGATKALASYPPPFNFIAAAAVVASGLAQVAQIRSQTYSGRRLGGPVMGGESYIVGESGPELFTPSTTGRITRNQDLMRGGEPVNVNFTIVANDTQGFDDLLIQREGMIKQMISDAMLERGQRSMI